MARVVGRRDVMAKRYLRYTDRRLHAILYWLYGLGSIGLASIGLAAAGCTLQRTPLRFDPQTDSGPFIVDATADTHRPPDASMDAPVESSTCPSERCDGLDNDCDGEIDETDPQLGSSCTFGVMGTCSGMLVCDGVGLVCRPNNPVGGELCNGIDDDCDTRVDEDVAMVGETCGVGANDFCIGQFACTGASLICSLEPSAIGTETCDGNDEDCDGTVDESPTLPATCDVVPGCAGRPIGCRGGQVQCATNNETCNNIDDDCDGNIDEDQASCDACIRRRNDSRDYLFCLKNRNWTDAQMVCAQLGMQLARVDNESEDLWIDAQADDLAPPTEAWWLGLRDVVANSMSLKSDYRWYPEGTSGTVPYDDWDSGEPNGSSSDQCARIKSNNAWGDLPCDANINFVCETL